MARPATVQIQRFELGQSFEIPQPCIGYFSQCQGHFNHWLARTLLIPRDLAAQLLDLGNRLRFIRLRFCRQGENRGKRKNQQQREQDTVHGIVLYRKWARRESRPCILAVGPLPRPSTSMIIFAASLPAVNQLLRPSTSYCAVGAFGGPFKIAVLALRRQSPGRLRSEGREAGHQPVGLGLRRLPMFRQSRAILLS